MLSRDRPPPRRSRFRPFRHLLAGCGEHKALPHRIGESVVVRAVKGRVRNASTGTGPPFPPRRGHRRAAPSMGPGPNFARWRNLRRPRLPQRRPQLIHHGRASSIVAPSGTMSTRRRRAATWTVSGTHGDSATGTPQPRSIKHGALNHSRRVLSGSSQPPVGKSSARRHRPETKAAPRRPIPTRYLPGEPRPCAGAARRAPGGRNGGGRPSWTSSWGWWSAAPSSPKSSASRREWYHRGPSVRLTGGRH